MSTAALTHLNSHVGLKRRAEASSVAVGHRSVAAYGYIPPGRVDRTGAVGGGEAIGVKRTALTVANSVLRGVIWTVAVPVSGDVVLIREGGEEFLLNRVGFDELLQDRGAAGGVLFARESGNVDLVALEWG